MCHLLDIRKPKHAGRIAGVRLLGDVFEKGFDLQVDIGIHKLEDDYYVIAMKSYNGELVLLTPEEKKIENLTPYTQEEIDRKKLNCQEVFFSHRFAFYECDGFNAVKKLLPLVNFKEFIKVTNPDHSDIMITEPSTKLSNIFKKNISRK